MTGLTLDDFIAPPATDRTCECCFDPIPPGISHAYDRCETCLQFSIYRLENGIHYKYHGVAFPTNSESSFTFYDDNRERLLERLKRVVEIGEP